MGDIVAVVAQRASTGPVKTTEPLSYREIINPEIGGPRYDYDIWTIIAAESPGKAKWAAWRNDEESSRYFGSIYDMPKFSVRLLQRNTDLPAGPHDDLWYFQTTHPKPYLIPEIRLIEEFIGGVYESEYDDWDF